jgi:hypothetical protein
VFLFPSPQYSHKVRFSFSISIQIGSTEHRKHKDTGLVLHQTNRPVAASTQKPSSLSDLVANLLYLRSTP